MSVYEVHLGSWSRNEDNTHKNYREIAKTLATYINEMGYTHIELLPIAEHPFGGSWGYQITNFFAPTNRFGTPDDFAWFINHLHSKNIEINNFPKEQSISTLYIGLKESPEKLGVKGENYWIYDSYNHDEIASDSELDTLITVGKEAIFMVDKADFDAVLMDIQMPKMDGYKATQLIREGHKKLPIIAMTACTMSGDKEKSIAAGMNDYISKPIDIDELFNTLEKWIQPKECELSSTPPDSKDIKHFTSLPDELPGIDIAAGLKRLRGNRSLYHKLLCDFYKDYQNSITEINDAILFHLL